MEKAVLDVQNLKKNYGKIEALKGISFSVKRGEIFALIGPNGAGKTTALRIISTILRPTSGDVFINGVSAVNEADRVRKFITYLPEDAGAYKNMTGYDYLKFMASLYLDGEAQVKEVVATAAEISGLGDRLKDKIGTYSKGMTRKILLARALMVKPVLAILDEPTSGLDVINAIEVRKIIKRFSELGMTVLLSSHNMLEVEFLSDRVAVINEGRILESGTPAELKERFGSRNLEEVFEEVSKR
jgi:ABC-2 type transport system ATP-binding protein